MKMSEKSKRYGLVIDLERCVGCEGCRIVCKLENDWDKGSGIRIDTVGGAHRDTPSGKWPNLSMYYLPVPCMHCSKPPCLDACPVEAISKREDGIVIVDDEKCNGCKGKKSKACIDACPYDAFTFIPEKNVVKKCDLCAHRIDEGQEPFCVTCCCDSAMFFGDLNDPQSEVSKLAAQKGAYVLKPEAGTVPGVHYMPAVHYAPLVIGAGGGGKHSSSVGKKK
jgi:Fe-S-cluster-containing dehydrogenase component